MLCPGPFHFPHIADSIYDFCLLTDPDVGVLYFTVNNSSKRTASMEYVIGYKRRTFPLYLNCSHAMCVHMLCQRIELFLSRDMCTHSH